MHTGIEVFDSRVSAATIDDRGTVKARASVQVAADLATAVREAWDRAGGKDASPDVGVASHLREQAAVDSLTGAVLTDGGSVTFAAPGAAAALAETWIGAAKGVKNAVYFAVSDRSVAGIVRDGVPLTGARGRAASVAWLALNPVEREDYRKLGCLEAEVAASGIVRRLVWRVKSGDRSSVQDLVNDDLSAITVEQILEAARARDGVSISVVRDTAKYLGMAAANLTLVVDPETLVLGGIMASAADMLLDPVRTEIARRLPKAMLDALMIVPAALGDDAAPIGAARLASLRQP